MTQPFDTILITGAAGRLGGCLRTGLSPLARRIRLADRVRINDLRAHEEAFQFDLTDADAVARAVEGVDAICHFGGIPHEADFDEIFESHMRGSYNVYEAARKAGVRRVVYASSVHAVGYYRLDDHIDSSAPARPDSLYGVAKSFVESLSRLYWDKFGIETVCLRIFSCFDEPADRRMLWSWLSYDDCVRLVEASLTAPFVGHTIAFGMSDNRVKPVDNDTAGLIGYGPKDSAEPFRGRVEAATPAPDPAEARTRFLGGWFVDLGHPAERSD